MNRLIPSVFAAILTLPAAAENVTLERWQRLHEINEQHRQEAHQKRSERELKQQTRILEKMHNDQQRKTHGAGQRMGKDRPQ